MIIKNIMMIFILSFFLTSVQAVNISVEKTDEIDLNFNFGKMISKKIIIDFYPEDNAPKIIKRENVSKKIAEILIKEEGYLLWSLVFKNIFDNEDFECVGNSIEKLFQRNYINSSIDISCLSHPNAEEDLKELIEFGLLPAIQKDLSSIPSKIVKKRKKSND